MTPPARPAEVGSPPREGVLASGVLPLAPQRLTQPATEDSMMQLEAHSMMQLEAPVSAQQRPLAVQKVTLEARQAVVEVAELDPQLPLPLASQPVQPPEGSMRQLEVPALARPRLPAAQLARASSPQEPAPPSPSEGEA